MAPDGSSVVRAFYIHTQAPKRRRKRGEEEKEEENYFIATDDDYDDQQQQQENEARTRTVLAQPLWARTADCTLLQIQQKLAGYVRQDERKGRAQPEPPLTVATTLALLEAAAFRCTYCARDMPRVWSKPRDPAQWTLDRVDNARPHQIDNVVPSCMECNLRRRAQSHWAFRRGAALAAATVAKGTGDDNNTADWDEEDEWAVVVDR